MSTDDDPWAGARTAARADVKSALARGVRTCPACGAAQETSGRLCDACGADTTARYRKPPKYRTPLLIVLGLLLFAAAVYPLARLLRDDAATERERTARREAVRKEAELARLRIDARPVRADGLPLPDGADPAAFRAEQVTDAEGKIAADGRRRAAAGTIDRDIKGAECFPYPKTAARRALEADPAAQRGRYECVAYSTKFEAPESQGQARTGLFGFPYWLVIEYPTGDLVWCKVTPRAGEGGQSLAAVPVPPPCREPAAAAG
jgi:hypothetical protein